MAKIVLDYDGTLHECLVIYAPAIRHVFNYLETEKGLCLPVPSDEELSRWIGVSGGNIWDSLIPGITPELKATCYSLVGQEMRNSIAKGRAKLYPNTLKSLAEMKQAGHTLLFLSNCRRSYMEAHRDYFELEKYFDAFYCAEDYGNIPKFEIFDSIVSDFPDNNNEGYLIVGDSDKDYEVACVHKLPFIGCTYGYGSVEDFPESTQLCASVCAIPKAVEDICQTPNLGKK